MDEGSACSPKNLAALIEQKTQASGKDIFTEAQRIKDMDSDQRFHYESAFAKEFGLSPKKKGPSVYDVMTKKLGPQDKKTTLRDKLKTPLKSADRVDRKLLAPPSEVFSKKFMGGVDKLLSKWEQSKTPDRKSYNEIVVKPMKTLLGAIDKIVTDSKNTAEMNNKLARLGLSTDVLYDARDYVKWLSEGGHLQTDKHLQPLINVGGKVSKAQSNINLLWTLGNVPDTLRVMSHYASRPGGVAGILKGVAAAMKETKGNIFSQSAFLKKQGAYGTSRPDVSNNKWDPFSRSITAQKNLVWHIDKAMGGDGHTGIKDTLFDARPWDQARIYRSPASGLVFGLARFPINEFRWYLKTTTRALKGDKEAIINMAMYHVAKGILVGRASLIPYVIAMGMQQTEEGKKWFKDLRKWDAEHGLNLIKIGSGKAFKAMGIKDTAIDLEHYTQPGGGTLGARLGSIGTTAIGAGGSGVRTLANVGQGKFSAAGINALATASALLNLTGYTNGIQALNITNSTTVTKLLKTTGDQLEKEHKPKVFKKNLVKAVFGQQNVKKAE